VDREDVAAAVTYLSRVEDIRAVERQLRNIIDTWGVSPTTLGGPDAALNPLIKVGVDDPDVYDALIQLAYKKRDAIPELKGRVYSRNRMQETRQRVYLALDLYHLQTGKQLKGAERKAYGDKLRARWMKARDEYVAAQGASSWKERNALIREFWDRIDTNLASSIAELRKRRGLRTVTGNLLAPDDDPA